MKTQQAYYITIADAIQEQKTFDLQEDTGGWPKIHWLVANYMLRDYTDSDRHRLLDSTVGKIERNLSVAIDYLQEQRGIPVYKIVCNGKDENKKNIDCITTDSEHRDAKIENWDRILKRAKSGFNSFIKQTELTAPEKIPLISRGTKNFTRLIEANTATQ